MRDNTSSGNFRRLLADIWEATGGDAGLLGQVSITGTGELPSAFAVSDLAAATVEDCRHGRGHRRTGVANEPATSSPSSSTDASRHSGSG